MCRIELMAERVANGLLDSGKFFELMGCSPVTEPMESSFEFTMEPEIHPNDVNKLPIVSRFENYRCGFMNGYTVLSLNGDVKILDTRDTKNVIEFLHFIEDIKNNIEKSLNEVK